MEGIAVFCSKYFDSSCSWNTPCAVQAAEKKRTLNVASVSSEKGCSKKQHWLKTQKMGRKVWLSLFQRFRTCAAIGMIVFREAIVSDYQVSAEVFPSLWRTMSLLLLLIVIAQGGFIVQDMQKVIGQQYTASDPRRMYQVSSRLIGRIVRVVERVAHCCSSSPFPHRRSD